MVEPLDAADVPHVPVTPTSEESPTLEESPPPEAPQAAPRRRRRLRWLLVGLGVLAVAGITVGVTFFSGIDATLEAYDRASDHVEAAGEAFDEPAKEIDRIEITGDVPADPGALSKPIGVAVEAARRELNAAREELERVGDSEAKKDFLKGLDSFDEALSQATELGKASENMIALVNEIAAITKGLEKAVGLQDDAQDAANDEKWDRGIGLADKSISRLKKAEAALEPLEKAHPGMGVSDYHGLVTLRRRLAEETRAICEAGNRGSASGYKKAIDRYNDLIEKLHDAELPAFATEPSVLLGDLYDRYRGFSDAIDEGEKACEDAQNHLDAGEY